MLFPLISKNSANLTNSKCRFGDLQKNVYRSSNKFLIPFTIGKPLSTLMARFVLCAWCTLQRH